MSSYQHKAEDFNVASLTKAFKKSYTLQDLRRFWSCAEETKRRERAQELYDIFRKDWRHLLKKRLCELYTPQTWEKLRLQIDTSINILRWAADEIAAIYSQSPTRTLEGLEEQSDKILQPYVYDGQLDLALDQACRLTWALREAAIRPLVVMEPEPHVVLDVIPPSKLTVFPNPLDPVDIIAIIIQMSDQRWHYWDREVYLEMDPSFNVVDMRENPYKLIPYIVAHAAYPVRGFWHEDEAQELLEATYNVGIAQTEWNHLRRLQSFKQVWVSADNQDDHLPALLMDPAAAIALRGAAQIGTLDLQADLSTQLDTILKKAEAALVPYGLRPEQIRGTLDAASGYALSIKLLGQERAWGRQRRVWTVWESKLWEVARSVLEVQAGICLPKNKLLIDWAEIGPAASPNEEADYHNKLIQSKVESRAYARRKLGFSQEESQQIEAEILEESLSDFGPQIPEGDLGL